MAESAIAEPAAFGSGFEEVDFDSLGLAVRVEGVDWGEASITPQMVKQAQGELSSSGHRQGVPIKIPLRVKEESDVPLAVAAYKLESLVARWQEQGGFLLRAFDSQAGFAGSLGYRIIRHTSNISGLQGWLFAHRRDAPDVVLTATRWPIGLSPEEFEGEPVKVVDGRHAIVDLDDLGGTVPGLIEWEIENENASADFRGLLFSAEHLAHPQDGSADTTAALFYEAKDLTPRGGAEVMVGIAAPPQVRSVGTVASGTAAISPGIPSGALAGDLLVMVSESMGETGVDLVVPGWAQVPDGVEEEGNTRLTLLYRIATGGDPTTINSYGGHQLARIIAIKAGTFDPASPFNVSAGGTQDATKAVSIPGATTTRYNCLILACASGNSPTSNTSTEFSAAANADLTEVTERIDNTTSAGDGGAIWAVTGVFENKMGAYGATTGTAVTAAERAVISVAINALGVAVRCPLLTQGWVTVLSSEIVGVGHMTHVDPRRPLFRLRDPVASGGGPSAEWKLEWRSLGAARWVPTMEGSTPIVRANPAPGESQLLDMGVARPGRADIGDQRWEWRLLARLAPGAYTAEQAMIEGVYLLSNEQWALVSDSSEDPIDGQPMPAPATIVDAAGVGTVAWSDPGEATADPASGMASVTLPSGVTSHYLLATGLGLEDLVPEAADILGVEARLFVMSTPYPSAMDDHVLLVMAGSVAKVGDQKKQAPWTQGEWRTYGGIGNFFGQTLTRADVVNSGFGLAISVTNPSDTTEVTASAAGLVMGVYYAEGGNENRVCFAGRSMVLGTAGCRRQHAADDSWGSVIGEGSPPVAPPGRLENRKGRAIIIPTQGDFAARADVGSSSFTVQRKWHRGYLFAREAAE